MYETKTCPIFRFAKQTFFRGYIFIYFKFLNFYVNGPVTYSTHSTLVDPEEGCFANRNIGQFLFHTFFFLL